MASKRHLKKDIDYLITEVILDCYACMEEHPDKDFSLYEGIINEVMDVKESLLEKINHFDPEVNGNSKVYFLGIKKDLVNQVSDIYGKLSKVGC